MPLLLMSNLNLITIGPLNRLTEVDVIIIASSTQLRPAFPLSFVIHNWDGLFVQDPIRRVLKLRQLLAHMKNHDIGIYQEIPKRGLK